MAGGRVRGTVFDLRRLMERLGSPSAEVMGEICGLNRKAIHNRLIRGIGWIEADELAVRCGFLPWEIWPEWELVGLADCPSPVVGFAEAGRLEGSESLAASAA